MSAREIQAAPAGPPALSWWDPESPLYALQSALGPALLGYVRDTLLGTFRIEPKGRRLLDLGCGGGFLAREAARLGFRVSAVDPSAAAVREAAGRAEESGLEIDWQVASGEDLPYGNGTFDAALLTGVLEHAPEIDPLLSELARVLKRGGVLVFSAFNRTLRARRALEGLLQRSRWTAAFPEGFLDPRLLVDPEALRGAMRARGLERRDFLGLAPRTGLLGAVRALRLRRAGRLSAGELGARLALRPSPDARIAFMGAAVRLGGP